MGKFATIASGAMLLLNLIQVTESISGSVVPLAMFKYSFINAKHLTQMGAFFKLYYRSIGCVGREVIKPICKWDNLVQPDKQTNDQTKQNFA